MRLVIILRNEGGEPSFNFPFGEERVKGFESLTSAEVRKRKNQAYLLGWLTPYAQFILDLLY